MNRVRVSVARHFAEGVRIIELELPAGSTLEDALTQSGLEVPGPYEAVGIFGRQVPVDRVLRDGDRVEIYRALAAEPKEARRARVTAERRRRRAVR